MAKTTFVFSDQSECAIWITCGNPGRRHTKWRKNNSRKTACRRQIKSRPTSGKRYWTFITKTQKHCQLLSILNFIIFKKFLLTSIYIAKNLKTNLLKWVCTLHRASISVYTISDPNMARTCSGQSGSCSGFLPKKNNRLAPKVRAMPWVVNFHWSCFCDLNCLV